MDASTQAETLNHSGRRLEHGIDDAATLDRLASLHKAGRQRDQLARTRTVEKWERALPQVPTYLPTPEEAWGAIQTERLKKEFPAVPTHTPNLRHSKKKEVTEQDYPTRRLTPNRKPSTATIQKLLDRKKQMIVTLKESIAASRLDPDLFGAARERKEMRDTLNVEIAKIAALEKMLRGRL